MSRLVQMERPIATASGDRTVRLWDVNTGGPLRTLTGHTGWVRSAAFSPDGMTIVSGSYDRTARLWDAATGERAPHARPGIRLGSPAYCLVRMARSS